ncbi:MAG TPA: glycosyltransferase N-terminal domain-containing protein [Phnomibacter sp.]|nr:glycosyltransferase N-terminal domain-containing protein [Phnomibacter sp.]
MGLLIYNTFLLLYGAAARLLSLFSPKTKLWVEGRRQWKRQWQEKLQQAGIGPGDTVVWMHASSLGEFEQGRPLIEALKREHPGTRIVVTFFSPSGYEARKHYTGADVLGYLPFDNQRDARHFVAMIHPALVLWIKYEYWYYILRILRDQQIPVVLVSGIFRAGQPFFRWYGALHRQMLGFFSHLFVQNEESATLASRIIDSNRISISGDTRFDSVLEVARNWQPNALVEKWLADAQKVVVAGSTWSQDEEEIVHYARTNPEVKWIIAPHNLEQNVMNDTLRLFQHPVQYSQLAAGNAAANPALPNVLIIDNIGMLRYLYNYATVCYVGGGFTGDGVHNVLEAAVYAKPVIHGPEYEKYIEAVGLLEAGGSFEFESGLELEELLGKLWNDKHLITIAGSAAGQFVKTKAGAADRILQWIQLNRLLTRSKNR